LPASSVESSFIAFAPLNTVCSLHIKGLRTMATSLAHYILREE